MYTLLLIKFLICSNWKSTWLNIVLTFNLSTDFQRKRDSAPSCIKWADTCNYFNKEFYYVALKSMFLRKSQVRLSSSAWCWKLSVALGELLRVMRSIYKADSIMILYMQVQPFSIYICRFLLQSFCICDKDSLLFFISVITIRESAQHAVYSDFDGLIVCLPFSPEKMYRSRLLRLSGLQ